MAPPPLPLPRPPLLLLLLLLSLHTHPFSSSSLMPGFRGSAAAAASIFSRLPHEVRDDEASKAADGAAAGVPGMLPVDGSSYTGEWLGGGRWQRRRRRGLSPFQLCSDCRCCDSQDQINCTLTACCFAITCSEDPFGVCSFNATTCDCLSCGGDGPQQP